MIRKNLMPMLLSVSVFLMPLTASAENTCYIHFKVTMADSDVTIGGVQIGGPWGRASRAYRLSKSGQFFTYDAIDKGCYGKYSIKSSAISHIDSGPDQAYLKSYTTDKITRNAMVYVTIGECNLGGLFNDAPGICYVTNTTVNYL